MSTLIVIEGIDCVGKSSVAKNVAKNFGFRHEHEPTFSSSYADSINFGQLNAYQREFYFMIDRLKHQEILNNYDVVLDRYRLTGIVYASVFGREALDMTKSIYGLSEFKKPDLTIFLDMNPGDALKLNELKKGTDDYNPKLTILKLNELRNCFLELIEFAKNNWQEQIMIVPAVFGKFDQVIKDVNFIIDCTL